MGKTDQILDLMRSTPWAFAQPHSDISQQDILDFAALVRTLQGKPTLAEEPDQRVYSGDCNGCGAPVYLPKEYMK